jgi:hypothetical protein
MFEERVPRRMFGPERGEAQEPGETCTMRRFIICTS